MMTPLVWSALAAFCVAGLYDCFCARKSRPRIGKPFLMPFLFLVYVFGCTALHLPLRLLVCFALLFCWLGDLCLMFPKRPSLLYAGVFAFALGHVCYVLLFWEDLNTPSLSATGSRLFGLDAFQLFIFFLVVTIYGFFYRLVFRYILRHHQGFRLLPFFLYALLLCTMSLCALLRLMRHPSFGSALGYGGSLLFLLSDTMLAINKLTDGKYPWVMPTYLLGQLGITLGWLLLP